MNEEWVSRAMVLATDYAEAYCEHQCVDDEDMLPQMMASRNKLLDHLRTHPETVASDYLSQALNEGDGVYRP